MAGGLNSEEGSMSVGIRQGFEHEGSYEGSASARAPRDREPTLTAAVELGWRMAELYAQVNDTGEPSTDTLLPAHGSLEPEDQLELQLRAAVGNARRAGVESQQRALERLLPMAREAPSSERAQVEFRREVRRCHIGLEKELWAQDEAAGRAYELGNGMSDTYGRISCAYRQGHKGRMKAWKRVFARDRIKRLQRLLDDLQSRLDPSGVAVVRGHLDEWGEAVAKRIEAKGEPPTEEEVRRGLRRQTVTWRQLIAGHKEPEAYLDSQARTEVRNEMRKLVWSRYRLWILPAAGLLFLYIFFFPQLFGWYEENLARTGLASAGIALAAALGITKASMLLTLRTRTHEWADLLWNQAVIKKVGEQTLMIEEVFGAPAPAKRWPAHALLGIGQEVRARMAPHRTPVRRPRTAS
jgi:hypothetical protein